MKGIIKRADSGDEGCLPDVRAWLDAEPAMVEANGPPKHLLEALLGHYPNLLIRETARRNFLEVRASLAGPDPTPLEALLAERAAFCWLSVTLHERTTESRREPSFRQAEFDQRRVDRAHRRFLSAMRTLAAVRKLALPALQVNIGENQVIAGSR